jgi:hypothetical protein
VFAIEENSMTTKLSAAALLPCCLTIMGLALVAPASVSAQAPTTFGWDVVQAFVEPGINDAIDKDEDLRWGAEPHIQVGPRDGSFGNNQLVIRLNLEKDVTFLEIDTQVTVLMSFNALCTRGAPEVLYAGSTGTTDLPDWVTRFFAGPISVPDSIVQGLLAMVNSTVGALGACGDVRVWNEGILIFPPDKLDPYQPSPLVSNCEDSTTGRTGKVLINSDARIAAFIDPGIDSRWPDQPAELRIWVSPDGSDASGVQLYQALGSSSLMHLQETTPGQGAANLYALPAGMSFVACDMNSGW